MGTKTNSGNFFEDFRVGQELVHATPRTVTAGDVSMYIALYGHRTALHSSDEVARACGLPRAPVPDWLAFHMVFGKTVPDVSLNAVANLGYAQGIFGVPVYPRDTVSTRSTVLGLKPLSNGKAGVVYVRSVGKNQRGEVVLDYCRWVMVNKRDPAAPNPETVVPDLATTVPTENLRIPKELRLENYDLAVSGGRHVYGDYEVGERIDHVDGMTIEEAEHQLATRLYQNTAKVHFDQRLADAGRFKRRLIYGGHVISLAHALSFNGLENAVKVVALHGGAHANPTFAGNTIYAYSEVLAKHEVPGRTDVGVLRLRLVAVKDAPASSFPTKGEDGKYPDEVVLDLDYSVLVPR